MTCRRSGERHADVTASPKSNAKELTYSPLTMSRTLTRPDEATATRSPDAMTTVSRSGSRRPSGTSPSVGEQNANLPYNSSSRGTTISPSATPDTGRENRSVMAVELIGPVAGVMQQELADRVACTPRGHRCAVRICLQRNDHTGTCADRSRNARRRRQLHDRRRGAGDARRRRLTRASVGRLRPSATLRWGAR